MKVFYLISSAGQYGAENMVLTLAKAVRELGCEPCLGVFRNSSNPHTEIASAAGDEGIATRIIDCSGRIDWRAVRALRRILTTEQTDVLHTHGYKADIYGYAAARGLKIPLVATCHSWIGLDSRLGLYGVADRFVLRHFDFVASVSDQVGEKLFAAGISRRRGATILNGVDLKKFATAAPSLRGVFAQPECTLIAAVGRLDRGKGVDYLLRAAAGIVTQRPDAHFLIIGDGPERPNLEALAKNLGIADKVTFTGIRRDMPNVYASIDILALPSLSEGAPMTILEAMAAGKAIVATSVGAIPTLLSSGETGILVHPASESELQAALSVLVDDDVQRERLGKKARNWIANQFSAERMAQDYLQIYFSVMTRRGLSLRCHATPPGGRLPVPSETQAEVRQ